MTNDTLMRLALQFAAMMRRPFPQDAAPPPDMPDAPDMNDMSEGPKHRMPPFCGEHRHAGFCRPDMPPPPFGDDCADMRMHPGKARILSILYRQDGRTQKEIADILGIRAPSLSEVLYKLEENGFVERRTNENDKRQSLVFITEEGRETAAEFISRRDRRIEALFSSLTDGEKEQLAGLLQKLLDANK